MLSLSLPFSGEIIQARPLVAAVPINETADWSRTQPHVAYDRNHDRYLFVWRDMRNDPDNALNDDCYGLACNADIYGHFVSGDGRVLPGTDIPIAGGPLEEPRDQQWPVVAYSPENNEYLVAWQEVSPEASDDRWYESCYDIRAQRLDGDGALVGGPITVSAALDCQWVPMVSYHAGQESYLLTWHDHRYRIGQPPAREHDTEKEIFGMWLSYDDDQLIADAAGDFTITTDLVSPTLPAPAYQQYSAIAADGNTGDRYVLWSDDRLADGETSEHHYDIFFQHLSGGSREAQSNTLLFRAPHVQEKPRASFNDLTGEVWGIWQSYEGFDTSAHDFAVQMAHFQPDSDPAGVAITVSTGLNSYPLPDVACSSVTGNCLAIWDDNGPVYQRFDRNGNPLDDAPTLLHHVTSPWPLSARVVADDGYSAPQFTMTFSHGGQVFFATLEDQIPPATPTPPSTPTPTLTPSPTSAPSPSSTPTQSPTPVSTGEPDLSASEKSARPTAIAFYQEVAYTITLRNDGVSPAQVTLTDRPPLYYKTGSASGGIWWDDLALTLRWEGTLPAGESRVLSYVVHGPHPPLAHDTLFENEARIDDGVHPPFVLSASVLANPRPTASATATSTPTPSQTPSPPFTATPTATAHPTPSPDSRPTYLPLMLRNGAAGPRFDMP
jgi:hypothetical protein